MCDADICLCIRIKENGRIYTFSADPSGFWAFIKSHFVRFQYIHWLYRVDTSRIHTIQPRITKQTGTPKQVNRAGIKNKKEGICRI
ncbi:hypothetical protein BO71DRAFT_99921 [Aspergillus ellipticus CBS 707.79]|uniref:Uncharacterized protein n=1 Tax=Aspergillus ellipticus CBS 707.79 TaxID=1448320 RepID=A0A319CX29_9EURO|nr:hypothetical protein BO71DRAFT_99921 [Aspergillus ellipticus CBS 707.79]